ncbi:MAG: glycosyltransferase [Xenococcaceae cyanobacterium MO_167.B52]|nr:glycosyltransferase [Xenococcaceae cyanobacterium MO_167.B52]
MDTEKERKLVSENPDNGEYHYLLGKALKDQQQWDEAKQSYQNAIDLGYCNWDVYQELGDILVSLEIWDEAIGSYQQAIKLDDRAIESYLTLGVTLLKLELFTEAVPFFRKVIELEPDITLAYEYLGEALSKQEKWDDAIAVYHNGLQLLPGLPSIQEKLADALTAKARLDLVKAVDYYLEIVDAVDHKSEIYVKISQILEQQGKIDEAVIYASYAVDFQTSEQDYTVFLDNIAQKRSQIYPAISEYNIADSDYALWHEYHNLKTGDLREICRGITQLGYKPLISIILPLAEWENLEDTITSIQRQVYPYWELLIVWQKEAKNTLLVASAKKQLVKIANDYAKRDRRIKIHTGVAADLGNLANQALAEAQGEYITLLQETTVINPDALWRCILKLQQEDKPDIIYGDEDKLAEAHSLTQPWFKPDWCPDLLLSCNYFGSIVWLRRSLVEKLGGFAEGYQSGYSYDLLLRATETTSKILHIPSILAHRLDKTAPESNTKVITAALARRGEIGKVINNSKSSNLKTIRYKILEQDLVSIIIPTRNQGKMLNECLESIFSLSTYSDYEVIIVDNGSDEAETLEIISSWSGKHPNQLRTIKLDIPFNYSQLNNQAVAEASGKYLLFLNDDTVVISFDWLEAMVEQAQRDSIGAVGALLLYPDNRIQHAGVILGVTGIAGHSHRNLYPSNITAQLMTTNYSAVTAACMMCRKDVFERVGGFNTDLAVAYNDVDFCLKLREKGYQNVFLPHVRLYHYESQTRQKEDTPEKKERIQKEIAYMQQIWGKIIDNDPCYNPNLSKEKEDYSLNLNPEIEIISVTLTTVPESKLLGFFIDEPKIGSLETNFLNIVGWVIGNISEAVSLQVVCNSKVINSCAINQTRNDVAQAYPQIAASNNSGFSTTLATQALPFNGQLTLQVKLANGMTIPIAKIQLQCR